MGFGCVPSTLGVRDDVVSMASATPYVLGQTKSVRPRDGSLIPPPGPPSTGIQGPYVYDTWSARRVPAVSRCLQVYTGLCKQMEMNAYRGADLVPQPRLLHRPDPTRARSWFVHVAVEDYLLEGNALCVVTSRGADGWPLSVQWVPAAWVFILWYPYEPQPTYYVLGQEIAFDDVIHVRRGADRFYPVRGVGVVEENLATLDRVAMEEAYERSALASGAVPSVAVIAPQATLTQEVADQAKEAWVGQVRRPRARAGRAALRDPGHPARLVAERHPAHRGPQDVAYRRGQHVQSRLVLVGRARWRA